MKVFREAAEGAGGLILGIVLFLVGLSVAAAILIAVVVWIVSTFFGGHATP